MVVRCDHNDERGMATGVPPTNQTRAYHQLNAENVCLVLRGEKVGSIFAMEKTGSFPYSPLMKQTTDVAIVWEFSTSNECNRILCGQSDKFSWRP